MKISYKWLQDYIKLDKSAQEIADALTLVSFPVESIESKIDDKIIIAEIKEIKPHPNADRLRIAMVDNGKEIVQIVCGANNIEVGQYVPLAQIGAKIGEMTISKVDLRGVESSGMLCSDRELGLSDDHAGIKILPKDYELGKPLSQYLNSDAVLDVEITPNRGDCLSHIGVARELSAILDMKYSLPEIKNDYSKLKSNDLEVIVENKELCPQYFALKINNVEVKESPEWLKEKLLSIGHHPINNIVDVTNLVMQELGQPPHAFDADKVKDQKIIVREAGEMEKVTTLNGKEYRLPKESLLITDENGPIAIAGIMGGKNSEIDSSTKNIIIESAEFNRKSVRKTSKALGLSTDASYRFERGIDRGSLETAIKRAGDLIVEIASGELKSIFKSIVKTESKKINIEYKKINNLLGTSIDEAEINRILQSLGFEVSDDKTTIPLWRHDIFTWEDLAEEVGRIYGYGKINHLEVDKTEQPKKSEYYQKEHIKDLLVESGFTESYNYVFLSEQDISSAKLKSEDLLEVANPLQKENKYLRSSLIPGLLRNVAKNPSFDQNFFFEIGNVFSKEKEVNKLGIVASGRDAKNIIENVISNLSEKCDFDKKDMIISELKRDELLNHKIKKPIVYVLEIETKGLTKNMKVSDKGLDLIISDKNIHYTSVSQFPPAARDLSFVVDNAVKSSDIQSTISESDSHIFLVELFDEFSSDKFGKNKKNVAYHIWMQKMNKAMTDDQANEITKKIVEKIKNKFSGELRG